MAHVSVLLNEVLSAIHPQPGQFIVDATAGGGGHAKAIAERVKPGGKVLAIDWDAQELGELKDELRREGYDNVILAHGNFKNLSEIARKNNFPAPHAVLFDLGFSFWHIERASRGFTFQKDEPLDMRYDPTDATRPTAEQIINSASKEELAGILREYGEEYSARRIAEAIAEYRKKATIKTTGQLAEIITKVKYRRGRAHPATKTFQALRIAVNEEFENIRHGLRSAQGAARPGAKIAVITFHSLEDRIVKNIFRDWQKDNFGKVLTKKVIKPTREELISNPRSRSAKLRVFQLL